MEASQQQDQETTQAQQVADQAREKVGEAAGQARETAQSLAGQAQDRIREQVDQRSTDVGERVGSTAEDVRAVGEELRNQGKDGAARIATQAAERIESAGSYLRDSDANRILDDVEGFGRSRPWAVLATATVAGLAAARFLKASSRSRYSSRQSGVTTGGSLPSGQLSESGATGTGSSATQHEADRTPAGVR
jgi:hypothetical protein